MICARDRQRSHNKYSAGFVTSPYRCHRSDTVADVFPEPNKDPTTSDTGPAFHSRNFCVQRYPHGGRRIILHDITLTRTRGIRLVYRRRVRTRMRRTFGRQPGNKIIRAARLVARPPQRKIILFARPKG